MRAMIDAHDARGAVRPARGSCYTCGFDSIPSDLGTWQRNKFFARFGRSRRLA